VQRCGSSVVWCFLDARIAVLVFWCVCFLGYFVRNSGVSKGVDDAENVEAIRGEYLYYRTNFNGKIPETRRFCASRRRL